MFGIQNGEQDFLIIWTLILFSFSRARDWLSCWTKQTICVFMRKENRIFLKIRYSFNGVAFGTVDIYKLASFQINSI